jgi:hypothetical protein
VLAQPFFQRYRFEMNQAFALLRPMLGSHVDDNEGYLEGLQAGFLAGYLHAAGFESIQRVARHGLFDDTSSMEVAGVPISLNVQAFKPAVVGAAQVAAREPTMA